MSEPAPCHPCGGAGCDRCFGTGRQQFTRIVIRDVASEHRCCVEVWIGTPPAQMRIAVSDFERLPSHYSVTPLLEDEPVFVIDDRRKIKQ